MVFRTVTKQLGNLVSPRTALALVAIGLVVVGLAAPNGQPARAGAGINKQINFQGRLLNNLGAVVADGSYNIEFKIYQDGPGNVAGDTGGTLMWTEDWVYGPGSGAGWVDNRVVVKNGYFSVNLGSICPLDATTCAANNGNSQTNTVIDFNQSVLWLSMNVSTSTGTLATFSSGDGEMLPMKRMSTAVYALQANSCTTCVLQGPTSTAQNTIDPGSAASTVALTVRASAGTGTPDALDVKDSGGTVQAFFSQGGALTVKQTETFSGVTTDITTGTNEDLTLAPNGSGKVVIGGTTPTITEPNNTNLNITPQGSGSLVLNSDTDSNVQVIAAAGMTTQTVLTMTSASYAHTATETGSVANIAVTDATLVTGATSPTTNGLNVATTLNVTGAGTGIKTLNALNVAAPVLTACTGGSNTCVWNGSLITTQSTGAAATITQNGMNVAAAGVALGTLNGVNIGQITGGNGTETGINIGQGWDTAIQVKAPSAFTQAAPIIGLSLDYNSNSFAGATGQNITGFLMKNPPSLSVSTNTTYSGIELGTTSGAYTTTANTFTYNGLKVTNPNLTQTGGTAIANGLNLTTGTLTTGGTQNGINLAATGTNAAPENLNGIAIGNITGGAGTEYAVNVGSGWDKGIYSLSSIQVDNSAGGGSSTALQVLTNAGAKLFTVDSTTGNAQVIVGDPSVCTTGKFCVQQVAGAATTNSANLINTSASIVGTNPIGQLIQLTDASSGAGNAFRMFMSDSTTTSINLSTLVNSFVGKVTAGQAGNFLQLQNGGTNVLTVDNTGQITLPGGLTPDITTKNTSGTGTALLVQPGATVASNGVGGAATLYAGDETSSTCGTGCTGGLLTLQGGASTGSGTRTGGGVTIDAGAGATAGGAISIGAANANSVGIGRSTKTTTVNGALAVAEATNFNGNVTVGDATTDRLTVTSQILGASPLVFQGATDDSFTTTLAVTDPAASSKTITLPNATGTVCLDSGNCSAAGGYIVNGTGIQATANFAIQSAAAGSVGALVRGAGSQTADLLQLQDSTGMSLAWTDAGGDQQSVFGGIGQYANLLTCSEKFDAPVGCTSWTATNVTVAANALAAPDGQTTAESFNDTSGGGSVTQASSTPKSNNNFTFSVWLKTASGTQSVDLRIDGSTSGTGTVNAVTATTAWQRFSVTQNPNAFVGNVKVDIFPGGTGGSNTPLVYAWGAQLSQSSAPQVYARVGSAAVTANQGLVAGGASIQPSLTDSTTLFNVKQASGSSIFDVDSTNLRVGIGTASPATTLDVRGNSTLANSSATSATATLTVNTTTVPSTGGTQTSLANTLTNTPTSVANTAVGQSTTITDATTLNNTIQGYNLTISDTGASGTKSIRGVFIDTSATSNTNTPITSFSAKIPNTTPSTGLFLDLQNTAGTDFFKVANNGAVTLAGGLTPDVTTSVTSGTAASLKMQPGLSTGASSNGGAVTIQGGDGSGTTNVTGGLLTLQGGSATGASGTRVGGSVTIDAGTSAAGAASNGNINVGISNAATITIGSSTAVVYIGGSTNGVKFDGPNHEMSLLGTWQHTRQVTLSAEYAGATMSADGSSNSGTMTSDNTAASGTLFRNYYKWTTTQGTAQDYDIWVKVPIPTDWVGWPSGQTICMDTYASASTSGLVGMSVYGTDNNIIGSSNDLSPLSITTWANKCTASITGGVFTAGSDATLDIKLTAPATTGVVQVGDITFSYLSKW